MEFKVHHGLFIQKLMAKIEKKRHRKLEKKQLVQFETITDLNKALYGLCVFSPVSTLMEKKYKSGR